MFIDTCINYALIASAYAHAHESHQVMNKRDAASVNHMKSLQKNDDDDDDDLHILVNSVYTVQRICVHTKDCLAAVQCRGSANDTTYSAACAC